MENQKYISELQNILNKKKMDGGFGEKLQQGKVNSFSKKPDNLYSKNNLLNANFIPKLQKMDLPKIPPSLNKATSMITPSSKISMGMQKPVGVPNLPKSLKTPIVNQESQSTENPVEKISENNDTNNELKNTFETINFQTEIATLANYLEMLTNCDLAEIEKFIKNNNTKQEQIANNENTANDLQSKNEEAQTYIKQQEEEIDAFKKALDIEKEKYQKSLDIEQKKADEKDAQLKKIQDDYEKIEKKLQEELEKKASATSDSNNNEINKLQEEVDNFKKKLQEKENEASIQNEELNKKILEKEEKEKENEEQLLVKQSEIDKQKQMIDNNNAEIDKLTKKNTELEQENEAKLKEKNEQLKQKETEIYKIRQKLDFAEQELKKKTDNNTNNTDTIVNENMKLKTIIDEIEKKNADEKKKFNEEIDKLKKEKNAIEQELQNKDSQDPNLEEKNKANEIKLKELSEELKKKEEANEAKLKEKEKQEQNLKQQLETNNQTLKEEQLKLEQTKRDLDELRKTKITLDAQLAGVEEQKSQIAQLSKQNLEFKNNIQKEKDANILLKQQLDNNIKQLSASEREMQQLKQSKVGENKELSDKIKQYEQELNMQKNEIQKLKDQLKRPLVSNQTINTFSYNDTCRFSGFSLNFPNIITKELPPHSYITIAYNPRPNPKPCVKPPNMTYQENVNNLEYLKTKQSTKKFILVGVNGHKLQYNQRNIIPDPFNPLNQPFCDSARYLIPQKLTSEQFTSILQATDCNSCIRLVFKEFYNDNPINPRHIHNTPVDPANNTTISVYVTPLTRIDSVNPTLAKIQQGGGEEDNEQVLNTSEFKKIKNTIDNIVIKLNNYKKILKKEKNWEKKYAKKLNNIERLINISIKINKLYEGSGYEKMIDSVSSAFSATKNNVSNTLNSANSGVSSALSSANSRVSSALSSAKDFGKSIKEKIKKTGPLDKGYTKKNIKGGVKRGGVGEIKKKTSNTSSDYNTKNEDKNVKILTKEKCKKLKKYLEEFYQLLTSINNDSEDPIIDNIKDDISNLSNLSNSNNSNELINKMMNIQNNFQSSDSDPNNATQILTYTTMIIYDILLISIILICIIVYILFVINIIKFLYECFLEVGNSQHNNLLTGNTLRYKLLGYVIYINNCNLPSLFSSFNSVDTSSSTFIRLSEVLKNYFTNKKSEQTDYKFESIFGELENKIKLSDTPENKAQQRVDEWKAEQIASGESVSEEDEKKQKETYLKEEIKLDEANKKRQYEENKSYKEPKFNIFLCIRLIFICIKLFITFITIIVISIITFILLSIVSQMANMDKIKIDFFYKQNLFTLLIKLLVISLIYIFIQLIIYKTMFVKLYNKYLNTYLNIIAIDLKINFIKSLDGEKFFDKNLAQKLHTNIDNDAEIEGRIIELINNSLDVSKEKVIKYITIYMLLKYLYSYNKDKNNYEIYYSYFIKLEGNEIPIELDIEKNNIKTFYSLIPNKHRSTPINYFKFNDIKNIDNIQYAEEIRETVNSNISQINTFISEANFNFDDDNFIVSLGWYILVNLILGTIYISIIIMITLGDIGDITSFDLDNFIKFNH